MGAMTKYFISTVEATVLSIVENVVFFFQAKSANPSDRVIRLPFVYNFPLYAVIYWWSWIFEIPDMCGQFSLCPLGSVTDLGLKLVLNESKIFFKTTSGSGDSSFDLIQENTKHKGMSKCWLVGSTYVTEKVSRQHPRTLFKIQSTGSPQKTQNFCTQK